MEENKLADEGQEELGFAAYYNVVFFTQMICLVGVIWLFYIWFSKLWKCFFDHFGGTSMSPATGGSSSHSNLEKIKYDVFISFRGEDTRSTFTSHLHRALCQAKIKAFIDEDDLKKGHEISPTVKKAIEKSKLCLVILSKHYASSRWCLEELVHILNFKGQAKVLPVFYEVDPSNVRKQQKSYAVAFARLGKHFNDKKLQKWRDALTKIADLAGWASNEYRDESQLIVTIVDDVIEKLKDMSVASDKLQGLVGIDEKIKEIERLLQIGSSEIGPIGIWGAGGIGKTTLAEAVCKRLSFHFETCIFLKNVREESKKLLEDKLFSELLEGERRVRFARDRIRCKKVLVVFDDVDGAEQLEQLITGGWFGPKSRIIITSRDKQVLRNIGVIEPYEVEGLAYVEARELFSLHAFKKNSPVKNKKKLSERVVSYAGGIPLALKVLGRHLFSKDIKVWESTLDKLEKFPNKDIQRVLRISYDALDDTQKEIFLDIALVLKGEKRDLVQEILDDCDLYATEGIEALIDKALITVDRLWNTVEMHGLLQMMAFQIVRPQSTNQDPRKGSRLCNAEDINQALKNDRGLETIEGISLDTSKCNREISLLPTTFSKMCKLRLLKISGRNLCLRHGPPAFPDSLRYLCWKSYPLKSISTNFIADKLVALVMRESQLEKLWEGAPNLDNLKRIDLIGSMQLTQVPDLSRAPKIESVFLNGCESLTEVPSYFQHLTKLKELSLLCCTSLSKLSRLPKSLTTLRVFTHPFHMPCCASSSKLERFPKISEPMEFLEHLQLQYAAIKELPLSITNLTGLKALNLSVCRNLEFLPDSIHSLSSLQKLDISFCQKLESLPVLPSSLAILDARCCTSLKTVSSSIPLVKQNWDDLFSGGYKCEKFIFIGCEMLDENARRVLLDDALFRILRSATLVSKYGSDVRGYFQSFWPGNEIPWWFSHKSDESSICIKLPHPDRWYDGSSYLGLAFCLVLEFHHPMLALINYNWGICGESVYMFPNGDSWKQRRYWFIDPERDWVFSNHLCACAFDGSLINSEYVCVFVDNTYGESLRSNKWEEFGKYITAEEVSRCDDTNGITGFTTPATASFSFRFLESHKQFSKIKKCGVHLLHRQEAERFGYVRQVDQSESSGDHEAAYSSDQDEEDEDEEEDDNGGGESDSDEECREAIHFESDDQEEA